MTEPKIEILGMTWDYHWVVYGIDENLTHTHLGLRDPNREETYMGLVFSNGYFRMLHESDEEGAKNLANLNSTHHFGETLEEILEREDPIYNIDTENKSFSIYHPGERLTEEVLKQIAISFYQREYNATPKTVECYAKYSEEEAQAKYEQNRKLTRKVNELVARGEKFTVVVENEARESLAELKARSSEK